MTSPTQPITFHTSACSATTRKVSVSPAPPTQIGGLFSGFRWRSRQ
jgi:hypothetical protein